MYYVLEYNIKVKIGAADMQFQFKGKRYDDKKQNLRFRWVEDQKLR